MKTFIYKNKEIKRKWHLINAEDKTLGRLSVEISSFLSGKNKVCYSPHQDLGDFVVVVNAKNIKVSGRKFKNKMYHSYTGYPGGLRSTTLEKKLQKNPEWVIKHSVRGMLSSNKLKDNRLKRLKVYLDEKHPYADKVKVK